MEPCRLCGAALNLSVENPRRVCAACGEINLPGDHSAGPQGSTIGPHSRGLVAQTRNERIQFWVAAVPAALAVPVLIQVFLSRLFARGNSLVLEILLALIVFLAITAGPGIALAKRREMSVGPAVAFWTAGFFVGGFVGPWLLMPLQLFLGLFHR